MSENREFVREPERRIPVYKRVGVLVWQRVGWTACGSMRRQKRS